MKKNFIVFLTVLNFILIIFNWWGGSKNDWLIYVQGIVVITIIISLWFYKEEKKE